LKLLDLSSFSASKKTDWCNEAQNQLKGKDPFTDFLWSTSGLEDLKPYYDESDLEDLASQQFFFKKLPYHHWKLYECVEAKRESEANKKALQALEGGCDGIIFLNGSNVNSEELFKGIDLSICNISIDQEIESISGMNLGNCLKELEASTPVSQIAAIMDKLSSSHQWIERTIFSDFFAEIATLRALRFLLNTEKEGEDIKIHSSLKRHSSDDHQWFLNTTAGLASILGGTYSLSFETAIGDSRISRNVGNIIREESGINQYQDQCGGSYYVESLTNKIIQQVKKQLTNG